MTTRISAMTLGLLCLFMAGRTMALNPGDVDLISVRYQGDGCPQGSARFSLSPDASVFTVLYDSFKLQAGGALESGGPQGVSRRCKIVAEFAKPRDMSFSVENADFRGFVQLDTGVQGRQEVKTFAGQHGGGQGWGADFATVRWSGPFADEVLVSSPPILRHGSENCSPAPKTKMIVMSEIGINGANPQRQGMISVDSVDGALVQKFNLKWKNCRPGGGHGPPSRGNPGGGIPGGGRSEEDRGRGRPW